MPICGYLANLARRIWRPQEKGFTVADGRRGCVNAMLVDGSSAEVG